MSQIGQNRSEPSAVDDVRAVRERIARRHGGNLREHVEEQIAWLINYGRS